MAAASSAALSKEASAASISSRVDPGRFEARADALDAPTVERPAILDQQPRVARVVEVALARRAIAIASSTAAGG